MYTIRQERPADYEDVYQLVKRSFATTAHSDGTEADYLNELRGKETFIPELSLVAEDAEGSIVGQIVLYATVIATNDGPVTSLVLSPISVRPDRFRQGIARAMMDRAFQIAREMGYTAVFLCGESETYHGLGFCASWMFGIFHKDDPRAGWCMAKELIPGALEGIRGTIEIV
ncbi:putative acetyltransferase [Methanoculleus chikugoensis]|jgi:predicted N-acetyltransferase YhbS|uniref:N-acetyltransferase n=2 Tax=Methanoculleus chikugoensis TaxID=118126 RepID=A0A1M4MKG6_9EURY|nr:N-acetyltransferase [Methanoculleus chikugoensis]BBL67251.1 N-acetyltransferase [Methanoculleus chikugoensis]SCL75383.1 putative acetyltransferase [Methanoculleus chikugoensis]